VTIITSQRMAHHIYNFVQRIYHRNIKNEMDILIICLWNGAQCENSPLICRNHPFQLCLIL